MTQERQSVGVAVIGVGARGGGLAKDIARTNNETGLSVEWLFERNLVRAGDMRKVVEKNSQDQHRPQHPRCTDNLQEILDDPNVGMVMLMMPSHLHREFTGRALAAGKKVFLEKPIAQNLADSLAIIEAEAASRQPMLIGFTRRYESSYLRAKQLVEDGAIGEVKMILIRNVIPYSVYFHRWHRRQAWSGGALNDKGAHLLDVMNWFAARPVRQVSAVGGQSVFGPRPDAPKWCRECDRDCPYRVDRSVVGNVQEVNWRGESFFHETEENVRIDTCVWAPGGDIHDHAVVTCQYVGGIVGTYFFTIFGPEAADQETMEVVGTSGRLLLKRSDATIDLVSDYGKSHEVLDCKSEAFGKFGHYGADKEIILEMRRWYDGKAPVVSCWDGLQSARIIEAAHLSIDRDGQPIDMSEVPNAAL